MTNIFSFRTMSDDDRDLGVNIDSEVWSISSVLSLIRELFQNEEDGGGFSSQLLENGKRAHHNELERKRRDHIKDSFSGLKDAIPTLHGDKCSRAQILKKASEYIAFMRRKNGSHSNDIEDLRRQNLHLENQVIPEGVAHMTNDESLFRSERWRRPRAQETSQQLCPTIQNLIERRRRKI